MINSESKIKLQENHWNSYEAIFLQERTDFYDYKKNKKLTTGQRTIDGAGVHLVRVLGHDTVMDYDPFLMLDSFDSHNPTDYIKGFQSILIEVLKLFLILFKAK